MGKYVGVDVGMDACRGVSKCAWVGRGVGR